MADLRILFFGTPDIAVGALDALVKNGYAVVGAVSQPDRPQGRHMTLTPTAVHAYCNQANIPCFQPETLKNEAILPLLEDLRPDVIVVIAYGKILPSYVLHFPKYGCINIHGSLLPKYRGAAPIQYAVLNGEAVTGMTTMLMDEGMDTGDIIKKYPIDILPEETSGELFERMTALGGTAITDTLKLLPNLPREKQNDAEATYTAMLDKSAAKLDFSLEAKTVINQIRGLNPWPVAYTLLQGKRLKVYRAEACGISLAPFEAIGTDGGIAVGCRDGSVLLTDLAPEGAKRMSGEAYLAGHPMPNKIVLGE